MSVVTYRFRYVLVALGGLALMCAVTLPAMAQNRSEQSYPIKPIRLVVPLPPGGSADALARPLAAKLGAALGTTVIVDNRPGGLMVIGGDVVAKAAADGYTLYLMPGTHVLIDQMLKSVPFKPIADFTPVVTIGFLPYVVMANADQPYKTLQQMLDFARANPEKVSIGVSDAVTRVAASALAAAGNVKLTIVEYKGGGPVGTDLLGNQIATGVVAANLMSFVQQGKLTPLAVTAPMRVSTLPTIPTVTESIPGSTYDVRTWYALAGPANLPQPIVDRLYTEIRKVLADGETRALLDSLGMTVPDDPSPGATATMMKEYAVRMSKLVEAAGITRQ